MDWKSLMVHLKGIVATEKGNITAAAKVLLKKLKDLKFVAVYDTLSCGLSVYSEEHFISILKRHSVQLHVQSSVAALTSLKKVPGFDEQKH
jgi:ABC-type arginine/histidine transport system permease subunit